MPVGEAWRPQVGGVHPMSASARQMAQAQEIVRATYILDDNLDHVVNWRAGLIERVAAALAAETERCARIAEESEPKTWPPGIDTGHMWRRAQADKIAAALRL